MMELENKVVEILKTIYDPEIPVDIFELGLIYEVKIDKEHNVVIEMTLTSETIKTQKISSEIQEISTFAQ